MPSTKPRKHHANRAHLLRQMALGYVLAGILMLGYAWVGVISTAVAIGYALGGIGTNLALFSLARRHHPPHAAEHTTILGVFLLVNAAIQLPWIFLAPKIGGLMLITAAGMIGIGFSLLRQRHSAVIASALILGALSAVISVLLDNALTIPTGDWWQRLLSAATLTLVFATHTVLGAFAARTHRESARRQEAMRTKLSLLKRVAHIDELTSLANRRALLAHLDRRLGNLGANSLVVGLIDLDHFKLVNDRLGQTRGDMVLIEVGKRLSRALRGGDLLARLGGDQFAFVLRDCPSDHHLHALATRLMHSLNEPVMAHGQTIRVGLSLGLVVHHQGVDPIDADGLLARADTATRASKANGRGQYRLFTPEMDAQIREREALLAWVQTALRDKKLELHYQPILTVEPGKADGEPRIEEVEALLRLRDARGLHVAGSFETVLDDPQLALPLGRFVLDAATAQLEAWHTKGIQLRMGVNISPRHFLHPQFLHDLRGALERHPACPPDALTLELTEHGSELDGQLARFVVSACGRLGVRVSLDDFGTGSASLTHLQQLEVAVVKIDRRFTRNLFGDGADLGITYGILRTAQMMGLDTVAEGVSTPHLALALASMGCRKLQGFAIARALPACELEVWLLRWGQIVPWASVLIDQKPISSDALRAMVHHGSLMARVERGVLDAEERVQFSHPEAHLRGVLGRWCASRASVYGHDPGFVKLMEDLEEFHAQLRNLATEHDSDTSSHTPQLKMLSKAVRHQFWNLLLRPLPQEESQADRTQPSLPTPAVAPLEPGMSHDLGSGNRYAA